MADAWTNLIEHSSLGAGHDAWDHLLAQEGGGTGDCVSIPLLQTGNRPYTTRRVAIANALVGKLKGINGIYPFIVDIENKVYATSRFIDSIESYPEIQLSTGFETRDYQGGGFKDRYLPISIKCFVNDENGSQELGFLLEDIETILEDNAKLAYYDRDNEVHFTYNISILSIITEEASSPLMVGEVSCEVRY